MLPFFNFTLQGLYSIVQSFEGIILDSCSFCISDILVTVILQLRLSLSFMQVVVPNLINIKKETENVELNYTAYKSATQRKLNSSNAVGLIKSFVIDQIASADTILLTYAMNSVGFAMTNDSTIFAPYDNRKIE